MTRSLAGAERILNDDSISKLLLRDSKQYLFACYNWSYSKGDTYEKSCVILTEGTSNLMVVVSDLIAWLR